MMEWIRVVSVYSSASPPPWIVGILDVCTSLNFFTESIINWRNLAEAVTLPTYIWELPVSNLDQGTGYNVTSQRFVNLHSPPKKSFFLNRYSLFLPNTFHFFIHQPYTLSIILNLGYSALKWTRIWTNTSKINGGLLIQSHWRRCKFTVSWVVMWRLSYSLYWFVTVDYYSSGLV
jgi:hypothetical protein